MNEGAFTETRVLNMIILFLAEIKGGITKGRLLNLKPKEKM